MPFNSIDFAVFLCAVFAVYWSIGPDRRGAQNGFILLANAVFYAWWDWRFLGLIALSSAIDFAIGARLGRTDDRSARRRLLALSLLVNLGALGLFKYFNFFVTSLSGGFDRLGVPVELRTLHLVAPIGISFYTLQKMSYIIDVYRRRFEPWRNAVEFLAYMSFFPLVVSGPIERASHVLPQFGSSRRFDPATATDGLRQFLWGLFKKVVIADTAAGFADVVFAHHAVYRSTALLLGALFFTFQIYGDFSGYSDMAVGSAKLLGFRLTNNFAFPYFSRDIGEFWRRWHISLSTWLRDYVHTPLGGNLVSTPRAVRNVMATFLVSGLWHGANWTFVAWGAIQGLYLLPLFVTGRSHRGTVARRGHLPSPREACLVLLTFGLTVAAWIVFRSESLSQAYVYFAGLAQFTAGDIRPEQIRFLPVLGAFILWEWFQRRKAHGLELKAFPAAARFIIYGVLVWSILYCWGAPKEFIYFRF